jgi:hypothetical protein
MSFDEFKEFRTQAGHAGVFNFSATTLGSGLLRVTVEASDFDRLKIKAARDSENGYRPEWKAYFPGESE